MPFRFITKSIHAYWIDYPVAVLLMIAPFVLGLGQTNSVAFSLSIIVGVAALLLAAITDHATGIIRIIPYWLHLWVDRAVGVVFVFAPLRFQFSSLDAWYYWVLSRQSSLLPQSSTRRGIASRRSSLDTRGAT